MLIGELIRALDDEASIATSMAAVGDFVLLADIARVAPRFEETPAEYARGALRRFANQASDEDWLAAMTAIERADDPGQVLLAMMLRWSLARDNAEISGGCSHGHGEHDHGEHDAPRS